MQNAECVWDWGRTQRMKGCYFVDEMLILYMEDRAALRDAAGGFWLFIY